MQQLEIKSESATFAGHVSGLEVWQCRGRHEQAPLATDPHVGQGLIPDGDVVLSNRKR
eukprot:CAMPEP_0181179268 /NCGR_PEP_ID=MMETSP1096-20121128/6169_1 /TAXON_ID=156174 ORGANISM="Chrysochromulina ericina, Strain CCMP281" /NCGR_SAMPLE_ID=MMETSP1096 /ASSEMBLY_ACC=CAM_ASM_000453 /LENGTH=57 /DNA_ID=CAMNT_0023267605 /DNA_START=757 /DNA_END=930 /DNA_ORIENTATION=+